MLTCLTWSGDQTKRKWSPEHLRDEGATDSAEATMRESNQDTRTKAASRVSTLNHQLDEAIEAKEEISNTRSHYDTKTAISDLVRKT